MRFLTVNGMIRSENGEFEFWLEPVADGIAIRYGYTGSAHPLRTLDICASIDEAQARYCRACPIIRPATYDEILYELTNHPWPDVTGRHWFD